MRDPIPPGTLEMVILKTLSRGKEMHGFQIADAILTGSEKVLQVEEGSLYPALQRLLVKGWISGEWGRTEGNRRARYYTITKLGRKQLVDEIEAYRRVSGAILRILEPA
jgi:PadR family transcriptional regulator, regulatory protein PadR